ncbi:MAG: transporter [Blastocatellia bacterium]|nr:transporter [Blastocatellia bacterium]
MLSAQTRSSASASFPHSAAQASPDNSKTSRERGFPPAPRISPGATSGLCRCVQWDWKKASLATNYLFFAPTGRYELGAPDNVGFGFWSHEFQLAGEYRLNTKHHTSLIGAINFEINGDKEDQDYKVGNTIGLNYGIARIIPVNKGAGALDLSILGTSVWQVTDDTGSDVVNGFVHDRVHSIGGRFNYIFVKHHVTVAFNFLQEYGARARFQGSWYYASITKVFPAH